MEKCKKATFDTWWDAGARLTEIKKNSDREDVPQRTYKCEKCGKWHLTKIPQEEKQKREQNQHINQLNQTAVKVNRQKRIKNRKIFAQSKNK